MITPEEQKKMEDYFRSMVEEIDLSLYKRFGYPEVKELGIEHKMLDFESLAEMYTIEKYQFTNISRYCREISGNAVMLFNRQDIIKMYESEIGAVELMFTQDKMYTHEKGMLLVLHHPYEDPDEWAQLDEE